jgi:hypothetical protein
MVMFTALPGLLLPVLKHTKTTEIYSKNTGSYNQKCMLQYHAACVGLMSDTVTDLDGIVGLSQDLCRKRELRTWILFFKDFIESRNENNSIAWWSLNQSTAASLETQNIGGSCFFGSGWRLIDSAKVI